MMRTYIRVRASDGYEVTGVVVGDAAARIGHDRRIQIRIGNVVDSRLTRFIRAMHKTLLTLEILGDVAATGLALAFLVQRDELLHRLAALATLAAWILHTGALIALAIELGRPPFGSLPEAISVSAWVVVLLDMSLERRYGLSGLGAF